MLAPPMLERWMPPRPKPPRRPGCCAGGRASVGLVVRHCGHLTSLAPGGTPNFVLHRKQSIVAGVVPSGRAGSCAGRFFLKIQHFFDFLRFKCSLS